jgi:hypothetical protein
VDILDAAEFFAAGLYDAGPYNSATGTIAAVPEPNVLVLAGAGVGFVALMAARRNRAD